jgi:hypothetical protein
LPVAGLSSSLTFGGKARVYQTEAAFHLPSSRLLASPTNIGLTWKGVQTKNTLAYLATGPEKSLMILAPGWNFHPRQTDDRPDLLPEIHSYGGLHPSTNIHPRSRYN